MSHFAHQSLSPRHRAVLWTSRIEAPTSCSSARSVGGPCSEITFRQRVHRVQTVFTVTVVKVASLIAIVIGRRPLADGEPERIPQLQGPVASLHLERVGS
jgi:hypothetical protein